VIWIFSVPSLRLKALRSAIILSNEAFGCVFFPIIIRSTSLLPALKQQQCSFYGGKTMFKNQLHHPTLAMNNFSSYSASFSLAAPCICMPLRVTTLAFNRGRWVITAFPTLPHSAHSWFSAEIPHALECFYCPIVSFFLLREFLLIEDLQQSMSSCC